MKKDPLTEPTLEDQRNLNAVRRNKKDTVYVGTSRWQIGYIRNGTRSKVTDIMLNEKDEQKVTAKCAAAFLLNGYFSILLFHALLWRWLFYVKQYTDEDYLQLFSLCKKKEELVAYLTAIMYLTEMKETEMTKTREEAERILREPSMAQRGSSERSTDASQSP